MVMRLPPTVSPDTEFFWNGLRNHTLLIQRCVDCGQLRQPPRPMCPHCTSLQWDTVAASGRGTVHSYVMPQYPPMPFMEYPYIVALVDLEEGVRLVSNLIDIAPDAVEVGMPVEVCYVTFSVVSPVASLAQGEGLVLHQFHPAS
ncbi:Zn-ribbon domain-containing OB-fold protein [Mycolicibacterium arenosum]|uniref:Zn-ribbon domain-containing OB-fold protein n=1 Tax=Mycolicibacterium arenosum TaxID=2952157 RepID=A0ABT1MCF4_9MYCO|nr:Zn-ribbon domain-containing OB-fold protein [Mycolicibacterium sp. CAU 1645]MCP9276853.1 Zn-ribbon domain-containing OB-fold protein [Mycolicibacterium sp. CAU 1645]